MTGGKRFRLPYSDVNYYYDNMDKVIGKIDSPLSKLTSIEKMISSEIRKIGGYGRIHGCIVDIDSSSHIFINPIDGKVTGYWIYDHFKKMVYSSIEKLIEERCPDLYENMRNISKEGEQHELKILKSSTEIQISPDVADDYAMYQMSRDVNRLKKAQKNILDVWPENESFFASKVDKITGQVGT